MSDGSTWQIPVSKIVEHHARYNSFNKVPINVHIFSVTIPLFNKDEDEIHKHANTMKWDEVKDFAIQIKPATATDYHNDWENKPHNYEIF